MSWIDRSLELITRHGDVPPRSDFCGLWEDRHPLNVPGRYYGAATDTCCDGLPLAPASLLYDHRGSGFVWRQPRDGAEERALREGASSDPFSGYAEDGDEHWTPALVREWWAQRTSRRPLVELLVRDLCSPRPDLPTPYADLVFRCLPIGGYSDEERAHVRRVVSRYLRYLDHGLEGDLRRYVAFLDTGRWPLADRALPEL